MSTLRRVRVLYGGVEVWVEPDYHGDRVIEFQPGQFEAARHAHVFLCSSEEQAKQIVDKLAPLSERAMLDDIS